ncbi:hypothetical protein [Bacillus sp. WMMC1349]|nr:hypothetical protein [Bacillus sp. WMMC1349]
MMNFYYVLGASLPSLGDLKTWVTTEGGNAVAIVFSIVWSLLPI